MTEKFVITCKKCGLSDVEVEFSYGDMEDHEEITSVKMVCKSCGSKEELKEEGESGYELHKKGWVGASVSGITMMANVINPDKCKFHLEFNRVDED